VARIDEGVSRARQSRAGDDGTMAHVCLELIAA
jgi:hypothetical protein